MKVYGIKTCGSVKKALKFFKNHDISYEFVDFRKEPVGLDTIKRWLKQVSLEVLFNNRGTKYRTLKLKELNLDDTQKIQWLANENMLIKRPVIEFKDQIIVAFDEAKYQSQFLRQPPL